MTKFAFAALLTAALVGVAAPVAAQDQVWGNQARSHDRQYDSRYDQGYGQDYEQADRYSDGYFGGDDWRGNNRNDWRNDWNRNDWRSNWRGDHQGYGHDFRARGEGWSIVRSVAGRDATRDPRIVRWVLRNFDRNRDGILTRYEGWQARRAFLQSRGYYTSRW